MGIQSSLNNQAFSQLNKVYEAMKNAKTGHIRGNMESITLRALDRCTPCLDDMTDDQKTNLDNDVFEVFKHLKLVELGMKETYEQKVSRLSEDWEPCASIIEKEITEGWESVEPTKLMRDISLHLSKTDKIKEKKFDDRFFKHLD